MHNFKRIFKIAIKRNFPFSSNDIISKLDEEFSRIIRNVDFARTSTNPLDKRLEIAAYFLSMFIALEQQGLSFDKIRNIALEIAHDFAQPKSFWHAWWKKWRFYLLAQPYMHWFLDNVDSKVAKKNHKDGFLGHLIHRKKNNNEFVFGFDIIDCGICKLYSKFNYDKFSSILCEVDFITSELVGFKLSRNGTIANGAHKCDFRFEKLISN
ncbi:MAG: L-2-amino-thiazoline-4-carboxylic acid hydrolase [Bacteroidia bacterium]|nr:L-2-amino-thiazoline-4-carboxylic acid hydrolase [Bacteroidia bacterium]